MSEKPPVARPPAAKPAIATALIRPTTSGMATASLITGIPGLCCFPAGIVAIVLGIFAIKEIGNPGNAKTGKGMAVAGITLGGLSLVFLLIGLIVKTDLEKADGLWDDGRKAETIEIYVEEIEDSRAPDPGVLKRVIEYYFEDGDIDQVKRFCRQAAETDVELSLSPQELRDLYTQEKADYSQEQEAERQAEKQPTATPIPEDVTFTIIGKDIVPGIKRGLDIRLNRKVSEDVLRSIAMELKNSDPNSYERTFIGYYLPDMKVNAGYWATTHFNPDLEVRILGLSADQEKTLGQPADDPSRKTIGSWLHDEDWFAGRITIFRQDGGLHMETTYADGSSGKEQIVEKRSSEGRKFMKAKRTGPDNDYYLIDNHGDLQIWSMDVDGTHVLVSTAKKIN